MSETNGHIHEAGLARRVGRRIARFSQHVLHEVGARFDEVGARLESIESLKLQAGLIQSGARALARFSAFAENSE